MRVDTLYGVRRSGVYKSISRPTKYTGVLGRNLVWFIPAFMAIQALVYGGLVPSQQAGTFPIIVLGGFKIRFEDILIIAGSALWLVTLIMNNLAQGETQRGPSTRNRVKPIWILAIWAGLGLVQAAIRGVRAGNVNSLLDTRAVALPLLYFALATFWIPTISLTFLGRVLRATLFPLVVVLTLSNFLPIAEEISLLLTKIDGIYGSNATALDPMVVFFYCLVWTSILFAKRLRFRNVLLALFVTAGMVAKISKPNWVYALEVPILVLLVAGHKGLFTHKRSIVRPRWLMSVIIVLVVLISAVAFLRYFLPETLDSYMMSAKDRITRPDARGDISGGRFDQMSAGLIKLKEAPIFGIGLGVWAQDYAFGTLPNDVPDHFFPLWVTIRGGFFTFIPVLILIFWYIRKGFRTCQQDLNSERQAFVTACFVYTLTMIVYSLYGVPQNIFEAQILFWLSVAVVLNTARHLENRVIARSNEASAA